MEIENTGNSRTQIGVYNMIKADTIPDSVNSTVYNQDASITRLNE